MSPSELALLIEGRTACRGRDVELRLAAGLGQSDVARLAGVSPAAISRWEGGERTPSGASAVAYARALRKIERHLAPRNDDATAGNGRVVTTSADLGDGHGP